MDALTVVESIKHKFAESGGRSATIPLPKGKPFTAELTDQGINVSNLDHQPFLPWAVFQEAICVLIRNSGKAERGDAMKARLGEAALSLDSVEGHVALVVYGKRPGEFVFRRIAPIAAILTWAGICKTVPKKLVLLDFRKA
jgi:hypothetical protein